MTAEAEKLLAQSQWRRMGLVTSAPAPAADVELAMERKSRKGVRRKRGEMEPEPRLWKVGGLSRSWLRLAVAGRPFTWMDVDRIMEPPNRRKKSLHTSTASQLIRTGLLRPVKMARLVMDLRTRKKRWSTSSYRGTAKARRLFARL